MVCCAAVNFPIPLGSDLNVLWQRLEHGSGFFAALTPQRFDIAVLAWLPPGYNLPCTHELCVTHATLPWVHAVLRVLMVCDYVNFGVE